MAEVLGRALDALVEEGCIPPGNIPCTRLCLEEALVNAIRHGNHCDAARKVRIEMHAEGEDCVIKVWDEGAGFSPEDIRLPESDQLGGRGVCLIKHYMDRVTFNDKEHCLEMAFRRRSGSAGACGHVS